MPPFRNEQGLFVLDNGQVIPDLGQPFYSPPANFGVELTPPQPVIDPLTLPQAPPEPPPPPQVPFMPAGVVPPEPVPVGGLGQLAAAQDAEVEALEGLPPVPPTEDPKPSLAERTASTGQLFQSREGLVNARALGTEAAGDAILSAAAYNDEGAKLIANAKGDAALAAKTEYDTGAAFAHEAMVDLEGRHDQIRSRTTELREALDNYEINPANVWRKTDNWKQATAMIGVVFGALSQFATGRNVAMETIEKMIDRDIAAQESNRNKMERQLERMPQELKDARGMYDNKIAADAAERAMKLNAIEQQLSFEINKASDSLRKQALEEAKLKVHMLWLDQVDKAESSALAWASLDMRNQQMLLKATKGRGGGGGPATAFSGEDLAVEQPLWERGSHFSVVDRNTGARGKVQSISIADKGAREEVRGALNAAQATGDAISTVLEMKGTDPAFFDETWKLAKQQMASVRLEYQALLKGTPSDKDQKIIDDLIGFDSPAEVIRYLDSGQRRAVLRAMIKSAERSAATKLGRVAPGVTYSFAYKPFSLEDVTDATPNPKQAYADARASRKAGKSPVADEDYRLAGGTKNGELHGKGRQIQILIEREQDLNLGIARLNIDLGRVPQNSPEYRELFLRRAEFYQALEQTKKTREDLTAETPVQKKQRESSDRINKATEAAKKRKAEGKAF